MQPVSIQKTGIDDFISLSPDLPVLDVRSPAEYKHAHIPGAYSFPIFDNEERHLIGTSYKQESREKAIKLGLEFFGKKLLYFVEQADLILKQSGHNTKTVAVHCWRGGMRSSTIAWLLDLYGYKVYLLQGGYKAYRNWVLQQFTYSYKLNIVSGHTGSNKTGTLLELKKRGEPVIDLEGLANHRGSAFGHIGLGAQPGQEQFENLLAKELYYYRKTCPEKAIWVEDESQRIGQVNSPPEFFKQMREQDILLLEIPFEHRLNFLVSTYGLFPKEALGHAVERIQKKLGGPEFRAAIEFLEEANIRECFRILLQYYDRLYTKSRGKREKEVSKAIPITSGSTDALSNSNILLNHVRPVSSN